MSARQKIEAALTIAGIIAFLLFAGYEIGKKSQQLFQAEREAEAARLEMEQLRQRHEQQTTKQGK